MPDAYRLHEDGEIVYVLPYEDTPGRRVVYRQDPESFDTRRDTVASQRARTLAERGRSVPLVETPAWCDPAAPRNASVG